MFRINNHEDEDISLKEKEEFLRKFFNVIIRIKPFQDADMFSFAKKINDQYDLHFKMETLNLASKEYSTNPRRVIQLFNNLTSELSNYNGEFAKKHEALICAVLILREEFSSYYNEVVNSPKLFLEDGEPEETDDIRKNRIIRFNRITRNIKANVTTKDLTFILTNSNSQFEDLPIDLKDAIDTSDYVKVLGMIESDSTRIIDYIIYQAQHAFNNGLNGELTSYFEMVAYLNLNTEIDGATNARFTEIFDRRINYSIEHALEHESVCKYGLILEGQGLLGLKRKIIKLLNELDSNLDFWPNLFNQVLKNYTDKDTSIELSGLFEINYRKKDKDFAYVKSQYQYLITESFIKSRIDEIESLRSIYEPYHEIVNIFKEKTNLHPASVELFFDKVSELIGDTFDTESEIIIGFIDYINPVLDSFSNGFLENNYHSLKECYDKIISRKMSHPNYPARSDMARKTYLINSDVLDKVEIDKCLSFVRNITRTTHDGISVVEEVSRHKGNNNIIYNFLNPLADQGQSLAPFKDIIFWNEDYGDELAIMFLKNIFDENANNQNLIGRDKSGQKINALLNYANDTSNEKIYSFLQHLSTHGYYQDLIIENVVAKTTEFINRQPSFILNLAISSFDQTTASEFSDNDSFLEAVALNGTPQQIHILITILIRRIDSGENVSDIVSIVSKIKKIKATDKGLLKSHIESYLETNLDHISEVERKVVKDLMKNLN